MSLMMFELFEHACREHGDKALFERPGQSALSYADAMSQTLRLSAALSELGIKPGDRVAVQVDKSAEAVLLYLATLNAGAVFLPLNTAYTETELDYFLGDATPRLFVCRPETHAQHGDRASATLAVETLGTHGEGSLLALANRTTRSAETIRCNADDAAAILYTSGTTGRSKGAVLTHGNLASNCQALIDQWRFTADDRLIHALPIFHTHGLFVACNMSLAVGATMIFLTSFDTDEVIDLMSTSTVLMGVPTFYTRLLRSERLDHETTAHMRLFVAGSAPLSAQTHGEFATRTGHTILERYGMTETCMIASNPYSGERRPGAVGFPLAGVEIRITERDTGHALPDGEIGSIEVRGPNVFKGYWQMPDKTASEFRDDGFFITGDLGMTDSDGYLHIVGRDKDLVISGGYNVYPKEIEALIDAGAEVLESAVIGLPHPDLGEAVTAVVVTQSGCESNAKTLLATLGDSLARYKHPRKVIFVEELPRNVMGKVQKAELRKRYADLYTAGNKA